jgi:hypothetical protein
VIFSDCVCTKCSKCSELFELTAVLCCYPRLCSRASAQHTPRSDRGPEREVEVRGDADIVYYMHGVIYIKQSDVRSLAGTIGSSRSGGGSAIDQGGWNAKPTSE